MNYSLEPHRIAILSNIVLDVVVEGPSGNMRLASSLPEPTWQEERTKSETDKDIRALPHVVSGNTPLLQAPQSADTKESKEMDLVQLGIRTSQGDTSAQIALGEMYKHGRGVEQDYQAVMD